MKGNKTYVAIIITDTLRRQGLEFILRSVAERCLVDSFDSFEIFTASDIERYDIAYVEDTLVIMHEDFFRGRKLKVIPIYTNPVLPENDATQEDGIFTFADSTTIRDALKLSLKKSTLQQNSMGGKELSQRETEVLKEVAVGKTNKEIADELDISMNTVMTHRKNITAKLGIKTVSGLTFYALMNGILTAEDVEQAVERDMN